MIGTYRDIEGLWLTFDTKGGDSAMVKVERVCDGREPVTSEIIKTACSEAHAAQSAARKENQMVRGDVVRVKGSERWNVQNYVVVEVFENVNNPKDRILYVSWTDPVSHYPRISPVAEYAVELAPREIKDAG